MGFIADWKAKRAYKKAMQSYEVALNDWQSDMDTFKKVTEVFERAAKGEDSADNETVQKDGEVVLWRGQGQFHEAARGAGQYVGSSQGISIPVVAGIRYRVGATRGTYVSGDPFQKYSEVGDVFLTTQRVLFNGMFNTKEWAFSKWNGASTNVEEDDFVFHVSNRQKTSGVLFSRKDGREFNRFLACAIMAAEDGIPYALKEIATNRKELEEDKPVAPVLQLPATKSIS